MVFKVCIICSRTRQKFLTTKSPTEAIKLVSELRDRGYKAVVADNDNNEIEPERLAALEEQSPEA